MRKEDSSIRLNYFSQIDLGGVRLSSFLLLFFVYPLPSSSFFKFLLPSSSSSCSSFLIFSVEGSWTSAKIYFERSDKERNGICSTKTKTIYRSRSSKYAEILSRKKERKNFRIMYKRRGKYSL